MLVIGIKPLTFSIILLLWKHILQEQITRITCKSGLSEIIHIHIHLNWSEQWD